MKTPGGGSRRALQNSGMIETLEHAEHDGADKGQGDIHGDNAQSAPDRTEAGHCKISVVHVAARLISRLATHPIDKK
jgi:hypothetical protein